MYNFYFFFRRRFLEVSDVLNGAPLYQSILPLPVAELLFAAFRNLFKSKWEACIAFFNMDSLYLQTTETLKNVVLLNFF